MMCVRAEAVVGPARVSQGHGTVRVTGKAPSRSSK
jgi:hypothetical protein